MVVYRTDYTSVSGKGLSHTVGCSIRGTSTVHVVVYFTGCTGVSVHSEDLAIGISDSDTISIIITLLSCQAGLAGGLHARGESGSLSQAKTSSSTSGGTQFTESYITEVVAISADLTLGCDGVIENTLLIGTASSFGGTSRSRPCSIS